jgi:Gpi18-like mannosyltransferase
MFDGALWGQVDSLGVFLFLVANVFLWKNNHFWVAFLYGFHDDTKSNLIYGPAFFFYLAISRV